MHQSSRWIYAAVVALGLALVCPRAFAAEPTPRAVVFVEPSSAPELDEALRDALTAQLSGGTASLVFEHFAQDGAPLRRQMTEAKAFSRTHHAAGVFWLDAPAGDDWILYLSDPGGDRMLARRIEVDSGSVASAAEAVSVIARQSADALLAGGTIGMLPFAPTASPGTPTGSPSASSSSSASVSFDTPPPSLPKGSPPIRKRSTLGLALSVAYAGDFLSNRTGWQSGLTIGASYHLDLGVYFAAGYTFIREADVEVSPVVFRLSRSPIYMEAGYALGHGRFVPSVGVRGIVDIVGRHGFSAGGSLTGTPDSTRALALLSPRIRLDFALSPVVGVFVAGGADFELNGFEFVSRASGEDRVLLEPNAVRPTIELGLSFWP